MLDVANASVHKLVGIGRSRRTEVRPVDDRHGQSPQGRVPCGTDPKDSSPDDHKVERIVLKRGEISIHVIWMEGNSSRRLLLRISADISVSDWFSMNMRNQTSLFTSSQSRCP